ncbi:VOC family protein [Dactylosporangium sp. NPDC005572]|uniref:VOC family protein n=1 Tax=Dactylosporangium sp. NPDC005572 TaxID=3156889 RepID=UPI0033A3D038
MAEYPQLLHTVLDTTRPRQLAEFYRQLLGLRYRPGDEPPADGSADDADWLVLVDSAGARRLAFQQVAHLPRTTWPRHDVPMQLHVDFTVSSRAELHRQRERAEALGAELLLDRTDDPDEPLYVFADLSGHPFCMLVA